MIYRFATLFAAVVLAASTVAIAPAAHAKECKADPIVQESNPYVSRSLGAFPSSLIMWRKSVVAAHGDGWQAWRRAEDRKIDCQQVDIEGRGKRWVCTRSARPCSGSIGPEETKAGDYCEFPGKLRLRMRGDGVECLQKVLKDAGYDLEVDGNFGSGTRRAVRDFQEKEGLSVDGVVGRSTWERLTS
ncbi:MAG: peptidoglycan-binding domain-containing protein [Pseudomonadota bacterium]